MPCPHHDIKIIQRSNHQSAVASAAYQSGERLTGGCCAGLFLYHGVDRA